jgi:hypothetical protein
MPNSTTIDTATQGGGGLPAATDQSAGVQWALANQGGLDTYNQNLKSWLADTSHTAADTQAAMKQYGVSDQDILNATGKSLSSYYPPDVPVVDTAANPDFANMAGLSTAGYNGSGITLTQKNLDEMAQANDPAVQAAYTKAAQEAHMQNYLKDGSGLPSSSLTFTPMSLGKDESGLESFTNTVKDSAGNAVTALQGDGESPSVFTGQKTINGEQFSVQYDDKGNYVGATANTPVTYQGHEYTPTFDAQGNLSYVPVPVNTSRGFFGDMISNLASNPLTGLAIGVLAPELLPSFGAWAAPAVSAGLGIAAGQDPTQILKNVGLQYLGTKAAGATTSGLTDTLGSTAAKVVGNAAGQIVGSDGKIDPLQALLSNGLGAGTSAVLSNIDGFSTLSLAAQKSITAAVANALQTGDVDPVKAVKAALAVAKSMSNTNTDTGGLPSQEEQDQITQNRLDKAVANQQASSEKDQVEIDARTQKLLDDLQGNNVIDETGIDDKTKETGGLPLIDKGEVVITAPKDESGLSVLDPNTEVTDKGEVVITAPKDKSGLSVLDPTDEVTDKGEVVITGKRDPCPAGTHYDEALDACVLDDVDPIDKGGLDKTCQDGYSWDEGTQSCIQDIVIKGKRDPCPAGTHYDEALDACVPDEDVIEPPVVTPPVVTPPVVNPPVVNPPVVTKPTTTTPAAIANNLSNYVEKKLDSSPQFLAASPAYQKAMKLAALHQLFNSLTPEMQAVLQERGIKPQAEEAPAKEMPSFSDEMAQYSGEKSPVMVASGGAISEMNKAFESLTPTFAKTSQSFLAAAPVTENKSRMGALTHMGQGAIKSARTLGSGLASGGLPQKYAEAAPKGHKPEFVTGLTGYYAQGGGTGQSDDISAMLHDGDYVIDADAVSALGDGSSKAGAQALSKLQSQVRHHDTGPSKGKPVAAQIADGEYVFPEAFVTALGGGDNKHGANMLNKMREELREHKRSASINKIPPKAKSPLDYLKMAKG